MAGKEGDKTEWRHKTGKSNPVFSEGFWYWIIFSFWTQRKSINEVVIVESWWTFSCRFKAHRIPFLKLNELSSKSIGATILKRLGPDYSEWECEEVGKFREVVNLSCSSERLFTLVAEYLARQTFLSISALWDARYHAVTSRVSHRAEGERNLCLGGYKERET